MIESNQTDYAKFYSVLKKAIEGYQRGLSQAIEQNFYYENELARLKGELHKSEEVIKCLKSMDTKAGKPAISKKDIERYLQEILAVEIPLTDQNQKRKSAISSRHPGSTGLKNR